MNKVTVLVTPQLGVSPRATTGGESYDRELLKQLGKLGVMVDMLLPKSAPIPPRDVMNWSVDYAPISHFVPPYLFNMFALPWVLEKIRPARRRIEHCHILRIHSPEYLFPTAFYIKKFHPEVPIVAHYHLDQSGMLWTKMNKLLLNTVDAVVADSEFLKKKLVERVGVDERKIHVIYCGVDVASIRPGNDEQKIKNKNKVILFLGRFIRRKRPDFAIEIFARLHKKHPNIKLVMIGEGPMEQELKMQSGKLKILDAVEFPGPLFGDAKLSRYHEADLFLFPSEKEGFVLVVLEAMAAGLPLLVPKAMGFPEAVLDGENGYLADIDDIDDWVLKAEKILFSPTLQHQFRKNSREIAVRKFSWETCAKKNVYLYNKLLNLV